MPEALAQPFAQLVCVAGLLEQVRVGAKRRRRVGVAELAGDVDRVIAEVDDQHLGEAVPEGVGVELGAVLEAVQAVEAPGLVANGHIAGNALEAVLLGFVLTDPRLPGWLVAGQEAMVNGLTDRSRTSKLKKLDEQIAKATADLREARRQEALAAIEREFANEAA